MLKIKSHLNFKEELQLNGGIEVDLCDGTLIGKGDDWEIWVEPLNFVLKIKGKNKYFSHFEDLMYYLKNYKIKFHLSNKKLENINQVLDEINEEIKKLCETLNNNCSYFEKKYGVIFI